MMKKLLYRFVATPPLTYLKYIRGRLFRLRSKSRIKKYLNGHPIKKLNIGCGKNVLDGWLNTDLYPQQGGDKRPVYLDATTRFPFADHTFDYIYSEHIFEHLPFGGSCTMLKECYRILKPGGTMRLAVPHLDFLLNLHQKPEAPINKEYIAYSMEHFCTDIYKELGHTPNDHIYVINNFFRDWGHQVIHDQNTLKALIEKFHFRDVKRTEVGQSDIEALNDIDGHGRTWYPRVFYTFQTLVFEAKK